MKIKKHISLISSLLISMTLFTSCTTETIVQDAYNKNVDSYSNDDYIIEKDNNRFFSFDSENASVALTDEKGNVIWSPLPLESYGEVDEYGNPISLHSAVKSALVIEYIEPITSKISKAYSYKECAGTGNYKIEKIEDGIKITYFFDSIEISVPVSFTYSKGVVRVSVDASEIKESDRKLYSISLAPYACGISNTTDDGYLFIPSGCGAIVKPFTLNDGSYVYSEELYGNDAERYMEREVNSEIYPKNRLAVYGSKISGNSAVCGIIENGAEHAIITAEVGAANTRYSSVWSKFALRAYQWSKTKKEQQIKLYSSSMIQGEVTVAFHILNGEKSTYYGMAETYRNYLADKNRMSSSSKDTVLNLKIIGGVNITKTFLGFKYNDFFVTTSLDDAKDIVMELSELSGEKVNVDLLGYGTSGIDIEKIAGGYSVNSKLGGEKGLKEFSNAVRDICTVYFNADVLNYSKSGSGISKLMDSALAQNKQKIKQYRYSVYSGKKNTDYKYSLLVKRSKVNTICETLSKKLTTMGVEGVGLDTLSSVAYSDYSNVEYFNKGGTVSQVSGIFSELNRGFKIAVNEANDYAAANSDIIFDTPLESSKNNCFSYDIPFYGIVFKGYVPMASKSLNLSANEKNVLLSCAEIGAGLSYTLIKNNGSELLDNFSPSFYGSYYDGIKTNIQSIIESYKNDFKSVADIRIVGHEILLNGLRKTSFENGSIIYTNYTDNELSDNGYVVGAKNYLLVKG